MNLRNLSIAIGAALMLATAALAVQPTTNGTEKKFQQQGVKIGLHEAVVAPVTAASNAATLNAGDGLITSEALTTAAGATYTVTLTNSAVAASDAVFASVQLGSATTGMPAVATVAPGTGSVVIIVQNIHASAALNGTIKIAFHIIKNSALNAD